MRYDARSAEAARYRALYKTARWARLRATKLAHDPLCERCLASDMVTEATVVHHGQGGHKGDGQRFWDYSILESLCKAHHDRDGQLEDKGKTVVRYDANGWPL
jgi:5-methylcytosine-specific restriction protein A